MFENFSLTDSAVIDELYFDGYDSDGDHEKYFENIYFDSLYYYSSLIAEQVTEATN